MILLEIKNRIIEETLLHRFNRSVGAEGGDEACSVQCHLTRVLIGTSVPARGVGREA